LQDSAEQVVLVASSEFTLKSYPVRRTLEQRLVDDLRFALANEGERDAHIERDAARLVVHGARQTTKSALTCSRVFGVAYAAPALLLPAKLEDVVRVLVDLASETLLENDSFAIRAHRSTPGTLSRREVELSGGTEVLRALKGRSISVDLEHPTLTIFVDLVGDWAYVYEKKIEGPGGLPLSSQWKMLAVLDSGPLTILAAYAMMRRGCMVQLFIPTSKILSSVTADIQLALARKLAQLVARPGYKAYTVDLDEVLGGQRRVRDLRDFKQLSRDMAISFAKKKRFRGIILADAEGNLDSLMSYRYSATELPIIHPLLGMERDDIDNLSRLVGISPEFRQDRSLIEERRTVEGSSSSIDFSAVVREVSF